MNDAEMRRIEAVNDRYQAKIRALASIRNPYERFEAARVLFADWADEIKSPPVTVTW